MCINKLIRSCKCAKTGQSHTSIIHISICSRESSAEFLSEIYQIKMQELELGTAIKQQTKLNMIIWDELKHGERHPDTFDYKKTNKHTSQSKPLKKDLCIPICINSATTNIMHTAELDVDWCWLLCKRTHSSGLKALCFFHAECTGAFCVKHKSGQYLEFHDSDLEQWPVGCEARRHSPKCLLESLYFSCCGFIQ